MRPRPVVLVLALAAWLTGCAAPLAAYPEFQGPVSMFVSREPISTLTEMPAGDYLVPDSQVLLSRAAGGASGSLGTGALFGLVGVAAAISSEKHASQSAFGPAADQLSIRFDALVSGLLQQQIARRPDITLAADEKAAQLAMYPFARMEMGDGGHATVVFQINVRFADGASGRRGKRSYAHATQEARRMDGENGWLRGNAAALNAAARTAFERLVRVALLDVDGQLANPDLAAAFQGFAMSQATPNFILLFEPPQPQP